MTIGYWQSRNWKHILLHKKLILFAHTTSRKSNMHTLSTLYTRREEKSLFKSVYVSLILLTFLEDVRFYDTLIVLIVKPLTLFVYFLCTWVALLDSPF